MAKRYAWIIIIYLFAQLSALPLSEYISTLDFDSTTQNTLIIYYQVFIFILAAVVSILLLRKDDEFTQRENKASGLMTVVWIILGVFMAYAGQIVAVVVQNLIFGEQVQSQNTVELMTISRSFPIFIIIVAIVGPVLEEIIFRKIIFRELYKRSNFFIAGTVSGILFAVLHVDFTHLLVYFTMSFVFAFIYVQSKRLIVPILAHVLMNTFVVIGQLLFYEDIIEQFEQMAKIFLGG